MRVEVLAVGTELLLGYVQDTNSSWIGEQLAAHGVDCLLATKVGDNPARIKAALDAALERADAVICTGGLGPTQDDVTREAIAGVMGVDLRRHPAIERQLVEAYEARGVAMPESNRRQADVPEGATVIPQVGTAPGLICPVGPGVVYALPGVPWEMRSMLASAVIPDLLARSSSRAVLATRTLKTWGLGESRVAEILAPRVAALDAAGNPALAFLASAGDGIKVRITARVEAPADETSAAMLRAEAEALLDAEEREVRALLGDVVFAVDDATMASVIGDILRSSGRTLAVAESLTGGLIGARLTTTPGASEWFCGGVVSYATSVKQGVLGVPAGPVVSAATAAAMATGAARLLGARVGLAVTGVAGPDPQEDQPVGTVWVGSSVEGKVDTRHLSLPGGRDMVRELTVMAALDHLRRRLLDLPQTP